MATDYTNIFDQLLSNKKRKNYVTQEDEADKMQLGASNPPDERRGRGQPDILAGTAPASGGQTDLAGLLQQLTINRDPVGYFNKMSQLPSYIPGSLSPFNTGFFTNPPLTPEGRLASQGGSAMTQWGLRGGVQGIDPEVLAQLMKPKPKPEDQPAY
jgi:hypothetical protein